MFMAQWFEKPARTILKSSCGFHPKELFLSQGKDINTCGVLKGKCEVLLSPSPLFLFSFLSSLFLLLFLSFLFFFISLNVFLFIYFTFIKLQVKHKSQIIDLEEWLSQGVHRYYYKLHYNTLKMVFKSPSVRHIDFVPSNV